jgi:hypothetical protein
LRDVSVSSNRHLKTIYVARIANLRSQISEREPQTAPLFQSPTDHRQSKT